MKKLPKVVMGVNTLSSVDRATYFSHLCMIAHTRSKYTKKKMHMVLMNPYRMPSSPWRKKAAEIALNYEADYMFFVDDDVLVPENAFEVLYETMHAEDYGVLAGVTYVRGYPFHPMIFQRVGSMKNKELKLKMDDHYMKMVTKKSPVIPAYAVGFSCCLINMEIIRRMPPPYFVTGTGQTEDVYFCIRVQNEFEPTPKIGVHTGVQTQHILMPETVGIDNVKILKRYHKPLLDKMQPKKGHRNMPAIQALIKSYEI